MTTVTLEEIKADQNRLAEKIAALEAKAKEVLFFLPETQITLKAGECYAGLIIGKDGEASYHLILLPGEANDISWKDAKEWAAKQGGELPTRREQSLLYANLKEEFKSEWYWSGEQHSDKKYAWCQHFSDGTQDYYVTNGCLRARAVRRVPVISGWRKNE